MDNVVFFFYLRRAKEMKDGTLICNRAHSDCVCSWVFHIRVMSFTDGEDLRVTKTASFARFL